MAAGGQSAGPGEVNPKEAKCPAGEHPGEENRRRSSWDVCQSTSVQDSLGSNLAIRVHLQPAKERLDDARAPDCCQSDRQPHDGDPRIDHRVRSCRGLLPVLPALMEETTLQLEERR